MGQMTIDMLEAALKLPYRQRVDVVKNRVPLSVAEHSYTATALYAYLGGKDILAMLLHDGDEYITGDIPGPAKASGKVKVCPSVKLKYTLPFSSTYEKKLGKVADILDLLLQLKPHLGSNTEAKRVYAVELDRMLDLAVEVGKLTDVEEVLEEL